MKDTILAPNSSAEPYQRKLAQAALWLASLFSLAIGLLNVFLFSAYTIASFNFVTFSCASLTLVYLNRGGRVPTAAWLATAVILFNLAAFLWSSAGAAYSFIWITVVPPFTFFLLGRQIGTWVTSAAFAFVIIVMLTRTDWDSAYTFSTGAFLNIIEVFLIHLLLFRYYERSRHDAYQALAYISETDKLTGLYNRQKIDQLMMQHIAQARASSVPLALVMVDVDHFKAINDDFGHLVGDHSLQHIANCLTTQLRDKDIVGRWGGEEFIILLPSTELNTAIDIAERIRQSVNNIANTQRRLTVSMGLAMLAPEDSLSEWVSRADRALYQAKHHGRNRIELAPVN